MSRQAGRVCFRRRSIFLTFALGIVFLFPVAVECRLHSEATASGDHKLPQNDFDAHPGEASRLRKADPYAQFTLEVDKAARTLAALEQSLAVESYSHTGASDLADLKESHKKMQKLDRLVLGEFATVREECRQALLPDEILNRCDQAANNYMQTHRVVMEALEPVLLTRNTVKGSRPKKEALPESMSSDALQESVDDLTLLERVTKARKTLGSLKLTGDPDLHNSRPNVWEVVAPQEGSTDEYDPDLPAVNVMAEASLEPPVPADTLPTPDVQMTEEIIEDANDLGNSPLAMYEYVKNQFEFQPYYGSRKGSVETLRQRCGNDYDLASLLIAMLRSSGFEARYASGMVEMPVERANSWLGVKDGSVAGSILLTMGLEGMSMTNGPDVVAVRCERVWVEAYVPRGRGGKVWVPMDPAFKLSDISQGKDIPGLIGFDAQAFMDEYYDPASPDVTLPRPETPLDLFKQQISDYLLLNDPNETVETVKYSTKISPETLGLLPASLPYKVLSRDASFSEIPASEVYQVRFRLYDGGTTFIDHTVDLPEIAGKRVTVSFVGATPADQATIDSYNGILNTPPYLIDLRHVLKIGGQDVAIGSAGIGAGVSHNFDIHFLAPVNGSGLPQNMVPSISNSIIAGEYRAVGLAVHGATNPLMGTADPDDTEGFMAQLRHSTAMGYLGGCIAADDEFGALQHAKVVRDVDDAVIEEQILVMNDMWGNPQSWEWKGLTVDADRKIIGVWNPYEMEPACDGVAKEVMILGGAEGSLYENLIFEDSFDKEAVSTIKILELAAEQGITIYKGWNSLPLPSNTLPTFIQNAIASAVSGGYEVTFPASEITIGNWTGCGYIYMDPCTGAAGYIISGGQNGGSTVVVWYDWLFIWSSKELKHIEGEILFPDHDSAYAKVWGLLNPPMFFTYRLRAVFDDDSHDYWRYLASPWYANIQFQFLPPDHYTVTVGEDDGKDELDVTIFDVEIKKSDESAPPEYLPVKPTSGTAPKESYKAVVDPDDLNGSFHWTGSSKLKVISPDVRTTDVEPDSSDPSGSLRAENLRVAFTPNIPSPFGGDISDDAEHKMTVYDVEFKAGDGTSNPPEYVVVDGSEILRAVTKPVGVQGNFHHWATESPFATVRLATSLLPASTLGYDRVKLDAASNPSSNLEDQHVRTTFQPANSAQIHHFEPHKMTVFKIDLDVEKNLLTLKHDRESDLEVKVNPSGIAVDEYKIEIKRKTSSTWGTLTAAKSLKPWYANIAGSFHVKGTAKVGGTEYYSKNTEVTNQFPTYDQIVSDAVVQTQTDAEWANTLTDCTETPTNQRRERAFWIRLNTTSDAYEFTTTVTGSWAAPADGASVSPGSRPADTPATPEPNAAGATYSVALFHTHTPTTFRAAAVPVGSTRGIGPSTADNNFHNGQDVPGVVYDYVESPAGSGSIPMGHPEGAAAQLYLSLGKNRRTTP